MAIALGLMAAAILRGRASGLVSGREVLHASVALGALGLWAVASSALAISGTYLDPAALAFLPLLVGFAVPCVIVAVGLWLSPAFRSAVEKTLLELPFSWLIAVHAIRVTALGTILKFQDGILPGHFILPVAVPDLLIGVSALPLARWVSPSSARGRRVLIAWSLFGSAIFIYAGFALHFSVATPLQLFDSGPTTESIFRFPLALVPTLLVPFFVGLHLAALWRLTRRG